MYVGSYVHLLHCNLFISIKWFVYYLVYFLQENSTETGSCWNFNPSTRLWSQNRVKRPKNTQQCPKRSKTDQIGEHWIRLEFFLKILSRRLGLLDSILVVQSRTRTLYSYQTPSTRTAGVSSRYFGLWDRSSAYFHPPSADEALEICIRAWSLTLRSSPGVDFCHEILSCMITNGRIRSIRIHHVTHFIRPTPH